MLRTRPVLLALLCVAGVALAANNSEPAEPWTFEPLRAELLTPGSAEQVVEVDVRETVQSIERVRADVLALSAKDREAAGASLAILSVTCPYTRAGRQLPFALLEAVSSIDASQVDPAVRGDLAALKSGLATHIAVSEALDAELAMPRRGDFLFGAPGLLDRAAMKRSSDILGETALLVDRIPSLVDALGPDTVEIITEHTHRVDHITGHNWMLGGQIRGWHSAMRTLQPSIVDPEAQMRFQRAIYVLEAYAGMGC